MSTRLLDYNEICVRYAKALINIFNSEVKQKECLESFNKFLKLKKEIRALNVLLNNPMISTPKKLLVLKRINTKLKFEKNFFKFLSVLCKHNRLFALELIYEKINDIINKNNDIVKLDLITTEKVDQKLEKKIKQIVLNNMKKKVLINNIIDKRLIGGMILKVDSFMIDNSISTKLENYKNISSGIM